MPVEFSTANRRGRIEAAVAGRMLLLGVLHGRRGRIEARAVADRDSVTSRFSTANRRGRIEADAVRVQRQSSA